MKPVFFINSYSDRIEEMIEVKRTGKSIWIKGRYPALEKLGPDRPPERAKITSHWGSFFSTKGEAETALRERCLARIAQAEKVIADARAVITKLGSK